MKKIFLVPVLFLLFTAWSPAEETVLICLSETSYAWHSGYCQGLNKCSHQVIKVSKTEAVEKYGKKKPCGFCY